jgi:O-antigen ligase
VAAAAILVAAPAAAAMAIAFGVPFGEILKLPGGGLSAGGAEAGLALAGGLWWLRNCARRRFALVGHPVWLGLAAMLIAVVASMPQSMALDLSVKELIKWLAFGAAVALGMELATERRAAALVVAALLAAGTIEAARGLEQAVTGAGPLGFLTGGGHLRSFGDFGQPNPFAVYLVTLMVLAAGLLLAMTTQRTRLSKLPAMLIAAAFTVMLLAVLASLSRGALLALVAGLALMVFVYRPRTLIAAPFVAAAAAGVWVLGGSGLLPEVLANRIASIFDSLALLDPRDVTLTAANFAVVQRMAIWEAAAGMWRDNPLLGVGAGNFDPAYPAYALPHWPQAPGHAHNYYLNALAETGVVGLLAYLALLAALLCGAWRAAAAARLPADGGGAPAWMLVGLPLTAVGLCGVLTVHHLFDNLYVHGIGMQVGLLMGLAFGMHRRPSPTPLPVR